MRLSPWCGTRSEHAHGVVSTLLWQLNRNCLFQQLLEAALIQALGHVDEQSVDDFSNRRVTTYERLIGALGLFSEIKQRSLVECKPVLLDFAVKTSLQLCDWRVARSAR
jgi:hypothetical protein